jgi:hypothetical protein
MKQRAIAPTGEQAKRAIVGALLLGRCIMGDLA